MLNFPKKILLGRDSNLGHLDYEADMIFTTLPRPIHTRGDVRISLLICSSLQWSIHYYVCAYLHYLLDSAVGSALAFTWKLTRLFKVLGSNPAGSNIFTGNDVFYRLNIIIFVVSRSISVEIDTSLALFKKKNCGHFDESSKSIHRFVL